MASNTILPNLWFISYDHLDLHSMSVFLSKRDYSCVVKCIKHTGLSLFFSGMKSAERSHTSALPQQSVCTGRQTRCHLLFKRGAASSQTLCRAGKVAIRRNLGFALSARPEPGAQPCQPDTVPQAAFTLNAAFTRNDF